MTSREQRDAAHRALRLKSQAALAIGDDEFGGVRKPASSRYASPAAQRLYEAARVGDWQHVLRLASSSRR